MRIVLEACIIAALLVFAGGALSADELLFGSDLRPKASNEQHEIPLTDGSWKIPVSRQGVTRLIQIQSLGPEKPITAGLACPSIQPMSNRIWVVAKGECSLVFQPNGTVGSGPVRLTVAAALIESPKIASPLTEEQTAKADQSNVKDTVTLAGQSSGSDSGTDGKSAPASVDMLRTALLIFGIALLLAIIALLVFLKLRKGGSSLAGDPGGSEVDNAPLENRAPPSSASNNPIREFARQPESRVHVASSQDIVVEKTLREHSKLLLDLSARDQNRETQISEVAERWFSMAEQQARQADARCSEIREDTTQRIHEAESRIAAVEARLTEHLASQSSRLQDLFMDLPALADLSPTARVISKPELARLEEKLVSASRQGALSNERLEPLQDESSRLLDAITQFARIAESTSRERTKKRLTRVIESATVCNNELFNLGQLAATQKHGFFVEMSLLDQNHLAQDLALALNRETAKLGDPEGYYVKRLEALKAHVCVAGIDFADLDVDAERKNTNLQQALATLLQTLRMTQIDPHQNDRLEAAAHQVVQFVRRVSGVQPGAIAHTMARGVQRGSEVIRKASVLLYE
jgi:hypothetical protein